MPSDFSLVKSIGHVELGPRRRLRCCWQTSRGVLKCDIRIEVLDDLDKWVCTRAGVAVPPELLDDLHALIGKALDARAAVLDGLGGPVPEVWEGGRRVSV